MKAILYIVAIVAIAAGGWFSYDSKTKFTDLKKCNTDLTLLFNVDLQKYIKFVQVYQLHHAMKCKTTTLL